MTVGYAIHRSTDPGAPQLANRPGSWLEVLDYVLNPAYWDKVFTATNKAVYRSKTGNRRFYRFDDSAAINSGIGLRVMGYKEMTSVDAGTGKFPQDGTVTSLDYVWDKPSASNSNGQAWMAVVSSTFVLFHFNLQVGATFGRTYGFLGDLLPDITGRVASVIYGRSSSSANPNYDLQQTVSSGGPFSPDPSRFANTKSVLGTTEARIIMDSFMGQESAAHSCTGIIGAMSGTGTFPFPSGRPVPLYQAEVVAHYNYDNQSVILSYGKIPFLYLLATTWGSSGAPTPDDTFLDEKGMEYRAAPASGSLGFQSYVCFCIALADPQPE